MNSTGQGREEGFRGVSRRVIHHFPTTATTATTPTRARDAPHVKTHLGRCRASKTNQGNVRRLRQRVCRDAHAA